MKWLKRIAIGVAALLVLALAFVAWLLWTQAGARFAVARAQAALGGKLTIGVVQGTIVGPLRLDDVRYRDPAAGVDAHARHASVEAALLPLWNRTLHVRAFDADGIAVALTTVPAPANAPPSPPLQSLLTPPLAIVLDRLHLGALRVVQDGKPVFTADTVDAGLAWTGSGLTLKSLAVRAPDGSIDLTGALSSYADLRGNARLVVDWKVAPYRIAGTIDVANDGRVTNVAAALQAPTAAEIKGTLTPAANYAWTASIAVPPFDPQPFTHSATLKSLAVNLAGSGDAHGGNVSGSVDANAHRVLFDPFKFAFADRVLTIDDLLLRSPDAAGRLHAKGTVQLGADPIGANLDVDWDGVELPADLVGQPLATQGALTVSGNAKTFAANGNLSIGPPGKPAQIALALNGTPERIELQRVELKQAHGSLAASGQVALQPQVGWSLEARADKFDPGAFAAAWPGALTFALSTNGKVEKDGPHGTFKLDKLAGTLRQRPVSGSGAVAFAPPLSLDGALDLASGTSHVALRGKSGRETDATVDFAIASLGDWLPQSGGRAEGHVAVKGEWPHLAIDATVHGSKLVSGATRVDTLDAQVHAHDVAAAPGGTLELHATHLAASGRSFDTVALTASGDQGRHTLKLDARGTPVALSLALDGALTTKANAAPDWRGTLSALTLEIKDLPAWTLASPAALAYADGAFTLGDTCLRANAAGVCISAATHADASAQAKYTIEHLPLAAIVRLAAPDAPLRVQGEIDGRGDIARGADGALSGQATLTSATGTIAYPDDAAQPLLAYTGFNVGASLTPQQSTIDVNADLGGGGNLRGHVTLGAFRPDGAALGGNVSAHLADLHALELVTPQLAASKGTLDGKLALAGTTAAPSVSGEVTLDGFATEVPAAGLKLGDGRIAVRSTDGKTFSIDGTIASGGGKLAITGQVGSAAAAPLALKIDGENFLAADIPGAQVRISPALTVQRDAEHFTISGDVTVPRANVDLSKLPGAGATKASSDVVVVDAASTPAPAAAANLALDAVITVKLGAGEKLAMDLRQGREVHLVGFGLDGNLSGQLTVQEHPGRAATGRGQISVNGTYKAYGQDLTIEQGRLLFAGTPVDNPGLDIRATRAFPDQDVTVGLQVRGTASAPELNVFSDPAMEQSDALSYLVAGKPLSQLRGGEGDAVGSAARALGTAGGDLLAKSIGAKMGIDEVGVADNASVGGAALTIGKYLSPRLYLSYGVGLFTPGEVVTLRYRLTPHFDAEMSNGTLSSRAGINYKVEK